MSSASNIFYKIWRSSPALIRIPMRMLLQFTHSTPAERKVKLAKIRYEMAGRGWSLTRNEARLLSHKNKHRGQRAFIICNGPSLKQIDMRRLKDEITIGCNGIFLMYDQIGFRPTYYTVEDTLVAEDRANEINAMRGTTKMIPLDLNYCLKPDEDTIFINFVRDYNKKIPEFSSNFARHVFWGGTVTYLGIQLAYYIGCREIYLIGLDHSYQVSGNVKGTIITSQEDDVNHFHPDYFGRGYRWHLPRVDRMEIAYSQAKKFFDERGVTILNASAETKLDIFPRISYEELF
jgi:hypothetical protein